MDFLGINFARTIRLDKNYVEAYNIVCNFTFFDEWLKRVVLNL